MSLPVLVALVVIGIALSVAAVHFTGGSRTATLAHADLALKRFAEDFPDEQVGLVRLTGNGGTAFLELGHGRTGIVHSVGDRFLTRIVAPHDIAALTAEDANTISVRFGDFTWRGGRFFFDDPADARAVLAALSQLNPGQAREAA